MDLVIGTLQAARFGAAKMLEGPQIPGVATNLEEWAHEEYSVTEAGSLVVVVAPAGASSDRAGEICDELRFVGTETIVVTDDDEAPEGTRLLPIAAGLSEEHTPAADRARGVPPGRRGGQTQRQFREPRG